MSTTFSDIQKNNMIAALEKSLGIVTTACREVGIARSTHYQWIGDDNEYKAAVDDIAELTIDFVESKLHKQISDGEVSSTIFYLKTKAKKRGYIERQEFTGADGKDLVTGFNYLAPNETDNSAK